MHIPNPHYNPDWETVHDYHSKHCVRFEKEMSALLSDETITIESEEYQELFKEWGFHNRTCMQCLKVLRYKTIPDFAKACFKEFMPPLDKSFIPPYESFKSIDEVYDSRQYLIKLGMKMQAKAVIEKRSEEASNALYDHEGGIPPIKNRFGLMDIVFWIEEQFENLFTRPQKEESAQSDQFATLLEDVSIDTYSKNRSRP